MSMRNVRLVIVDSVAAVFRADFDQKQLFARARHLCSIGSRLRDLATKYSAAVVVVNQVTADLNAGSRRYVGAREGCNASCTHRSAHSMYCMHVRLYVHRTSCNRQEVHRYSMFCCSCVTRPPG